MKRNEIVRVGEKNNFNQTTPEFQELAKHEKPGRLFFVNSNAKSEIVNGYPSIVTINPMLDEIETRRGDWTNVKAVRVKVVLTAFDNDVSKAQARALKSCKTGAPALVTFMRFKGRNSLIKFTGLDISELPLKRQRFEIENHGYTFNKGYYRPNKEAQEKLKALAADLTGGNFRVCDEAGTGCPDCGNCADLTYGLKDVPVSALNLSISGILDRNGKQGVCPFDCPDCWGKSITRGLSPKCNIVFQNNKQLGKTSHI